MNLLEARRRPQHRHKLLERHEELLLAHAAREGDQRAREALINANVKLVWGWARKSCGLTLEDRFSAGMTGLIKAADKYDPTRGIKFATVATWWIKQAIGRAVDDTGNLIHVPECLLGDLRRQHQGKPTRHNPDSLRAAAVALTPARSLDAPARTGDDEGSLYEALADPYAVDPETALMLLEMDC